MFLGPLDARYLRRTYLLGIDLGQAWSGRPGDEALTALLFAQEAEAERVLGIRFRREIVLTYPDTGMVLEQDYTITGTPIPYLPPVPQATTYALTLPHPDVQTIDRVRLYDGLSSDLVPIPVFETVPLTDVLVHETTRQVHVPLTDVTAPLLAQSWAIDYTLGLGRIPADVAEWMALGVVLQVLSIAGAGMDMAHGLSARTLTMDGQSQSTTYAGQGKYGIYAGTIATLQDRYDAIDLRVLRMRYQGLIFPTLHQ